jgi:(p)ppGpp synthase/HD superfamily hydrolase
MIIRETDFWQQLENDQSLLIATCKAINYAIDLHGEQKYDHNPYSFHLFEVLQILVDAYMLGDPFDAQDILAAGVCHDTLEDCNITYNDLVKEIGKPAADIVYDVTNELGKNRKERATKTYPKIADNPRAIIVKLADRIANMRYSQRAGSSMYKKYLSEMPEFKAALHNPGYFETYPMMGILWEELEKFV